MTTGRTMNISQDLMLAHVALVGARMDIFREQGFTSRIQLSNRRIAPVLEKPLTALDPGGRIAALNHNLPVWVHNIITDDHFPSGSALIGAVKRFNGELHDCQDNSVVSLVLQHGFKNEAFNPLSLPKGLSTRERCAILVHIEPWRQAYDRLQRDLTSELLQRIPHLDDWINFARSAQFIDIDKSLAVG